MIKAHNLIDIKTRPRHPESNGIVERFNGTVRDETDNNYGGNYLQAEAIIATLMRKRCLRDVVYADGRVCKADRSGLAAKCCFHRRGVSSATLLAG